MAKVGQVAKAALQRILVQASEADLEPDEYQDFIFALNNFMLSLDADGINLGYSVVKDLADDVTVPVGALRGIIANMAIEVAPDYGGQVTPALQAAAIEGLAVMRKLGQRMTQTEFPSNLPYGSGQSANNQLNYARYYPELEATILAETTGSIGLESNTDNV